MSKTSCNVQNGALVGYMKNTSTRSATSPSQFLPSANEVCEGYVFTPVILSTGGGGCLGPGPEGVCPGGCPGPGPESVCLGEGCPGLGLGGSRPRGCPGPGPGGVCIPACTEADTPPQQTATAADGTHPTGMHSCY